MTIWSDYPLMAMLAIPVLALLLMYQLRAYAHALIIRFATLLHGQFRLAARACLRSEQRIRLRNHEVTKALAEALMERQMERRFMRIEQLVERDLDNYQTLSADVKQQLVRINEDYEASSEVPDASPEWIAAVDAIASLQGGERNSEVVSKILAEIHNTVKQHQRDAMREHRWTVSARHKLLSGLRPQWRRLDKMLEHIGHNIDVLRQRLRQVDRHMGQFEMLTAGSGQGIMSSMLMRFVTALCFVMVGVGAAWINLQLLQEPLAEVMTQRQIGGVSLAGLVALLHIAITLVAATMISDSLRITHFFPLIGAMTRRGRNTLIGVGGSLLLLLAAIEALALLGTSTATDASIAIGATELSGISLWILLALGAVMPVMLASIVIPLEYLLHTVRPVVGSVIQVLLHMSALVLRLVASLFLNVGKFAVQCYDAVIFLPLSLERSWLLRRQRKAAAVGAEKRVQPPKYETQNVTALRFGATERRKG
ncbi:MAG: hypothetical protein V3T17_00350 [Pseudomonadales bacterium]